MSEQLIPKVGFAWAMRSIAFLLLGLLIIANLTVKSRLKHRSKPFAISEFLRPLKEARFVFTALAAFFFFWGVFLPWNFITLQAEASGMSPYLAGFLLSILNAVR